MITSCIGKRGRTANTIFQYAVMEGLQKPYIVPSDWELLPYLQNPPPSGTYVSSTTIEEKQYHYAPLEVPDDCYLFGYWQSEKYFKHVEDKVRHHLTFKPEIVSSLRDKFKPVFTKPVIAVQVRRDDYINNDAYIVLQPHYFISALEKHFPDWRNSNLLFFSDDFPWCKIHFGCLDNAHYAELPGIEQLILLTQCNGFVLSNSTFGLWGALMSEWNKNVSI